MTALTRKDITRDFIRSIVVFHLGNYLLDLFIRKFPENIRSIIGVQIFQLFGHFFRRKRSQETIPHLFFQFH